MGDGGIIITNIKNWLLDTQIQKSWNENRDEQIWGVNAEYNHYKL